MELEQVREREHRIVNAIGDGLLSVAMAERTLRRIRSDRARITAALDEGIMPEVTWSEEDEAYAVAERFLRRLPTMGLHHWPIWFSQDPQLEAMAIRMEIEEEFAEMPLLTKQAIIRSTLRVVVTPRKEEGERIRITPL